MNRKCILRNELVNCNNNAEIKYINCNDKAGIIKQGNCNDNADIIKQINCFGNADV